MTLNNYQIKLLAAMLMLVDHIGAIFFPSMAIFRIVGRFSFPLFILLLVDGEQYTRNFGQYGLRLLLLGILSQPIFWQLFRTSQGNILFTLLLGLLCLRLVRAFPQWQLLIWLLGGTIAQWLLLEYRAYGIVAIALIHRLQISAVWWAGWIGLHLGLVMIAPNFATLQFPAVFAPFLLYLANHQRGQQARWFYLFYPLHLLVFWLLHQVLAV
ncbi:TraX family protein [Pantanalinema sp. GBBB05]|uniref:TraX family protein n=1 Tax=Pantanalinema sp. GBBB05 TaxID=2604139 RepID=UPI001D1C4EB6|nr:TraX family protein [Pantanalinema sp. GBBB05]